MIVVFGSINVDLVVEVPALPRAGETVLGPGYRVVPGGKGANQAVAAARDGAAVRLVGRVGRDGFAEPALAGLRAAGIDLSLVAPDDAPTGCALIAVDPEGRNQIVVAAGANGRVAADQLPDAWLGPGTTLVLQMEVPAAEIASLVARARRRGGRVVLNLAPALPLSEAALRAVDLLIVNEGEAAALGAAAGDPAPLAARLGTTVAVTRGADGAASAGPLGSWRVAALPLRPVDTTAAGDAFVGVLAAALDRGQDLGASLHRASVAAGLACLTPGAQPSLPGTAAIDARLGDLPAPRRR